MGPVRTRLLLLAAAVLFVLVISCANVANLSLSRAATREREIAIRTAIGAGPRRIARQLLIESLVLSSIGAVVGLIASFPLLTILTRVLPADTPRLAEVAVDWRTMLFTAGLALATGVTFGLAPVLYTLRLRLPAVLDGGARGGGRTVAGWVRSTLAIVQVACAVLLVVSAALLLRSLWKMTHVDPGFRAASRLTAHVAPEESRVSPNRRDAWPPIARSQIKPADAAGRARGGVRQHAAADRRGRQAIDPDSGSRPRSGQGRAAGAPQRGHA